MIPIRGVSAPDRNGLHRRPDPRLLREARLDRMDGKLGRFLGWAERIAFAAWLAVIVILLLVG